MAGFSKLYAIGEPGGFQGSDGIGAIRLQILVGDADRQWLEPHYFDKKIKPMGSVRTIIPAGPNSVLGLLDACLAFFPKHFEACPSFGVVAAQLTDTTRLDFDMHKANVPEKWSDLRREAWPFFKSLSIFEAAFVPAVLPEELPK